MAGRRRPRPSPPGRRLGPEPSCSHSFAVKEEGPGWTGRSFPTGAGSGGAADDDPHPMGGTPMTPASGLPFRHQLGQEFEDQHGVIPGQARGTRREHRQRTAHVLDLPQLIQVLPPHGRKLTRTCVPIQVIRLRTSGGRPAARTALGSRGPEVAELSGECSISLTHVGAIQGAAGTDPP
jgi:hypothetical protein